ncbi:cation:proton antiporter [Helicobacter sp. MIT 99-5507]|uniref:cation:proton antiporter n=1 Tax=Helicobacter sp. MIT 99-5507 TaxID=152489 RepID=UPI000E1F23EB|nr:cation:proton antiporter [Helicobacter sp. MIT 99-5507]RDU57258.1 sodium:proton antiporter [Helicobacter sp. MIT 99-5507]
MQDLVFFAIISVLVFVAPMINNLIKIPVVVVEILLGALAINSGIIIESNSVKEVAQIGFLFLMFLAGIEVDLKSFKVMGKSFLKQVAMYFFILYSVTCLVILLLDLPVIYIVAFPIMSLGMIMMLIQEYGKQYDWLNLCLKIGIIGELVSILMLVVLNGYYSFGMGVELYKSLGILIVFLIIMIILFQIFNIIFWWFPDLRLLFMPDSSKSNQDIRYSMMLFLIMVVIVSLLHIEPALGAFLSGLIISNYFKYKKELHHKLNEFGFGFLIPLFFVYIGTTLDFELIFADKSIVLHALQICVIMIIIRIISASLVFNSYFKNVKSIFLFALSDAMPLTFLIAMATLGLNIGALQIEQYYSFVLSAMLEAVLFMIVIKIILHFTEDSKKEV